MMGVRSQQDRARERACDLLDLLAGEDFDGLAGSTATLLVDDGADRDLLFPLLVELTDACTQLITIDDPVRSSETAYVVDITDEDGEEVAIDELPAALRALLRAVLAGLEGHRDDQLFQLELAVTESDVQGKLDALTHALGSVSELAARPRTHDELPAWLRGRAWSARRR